MQEILTHPANVGILRAAIRKGDFGSPTEQINARAIQDAVETRTLTGLKLSNNV